MLSCRCSRRLFQVVCYASAANVPSAPTASSARSAHTAPSALRPTPTPTPFAIDAIRYHHTSVNFLNELTALDFDQTNTWCHCHAVVAMAWLSRGVACWRRTEMRACFYRASMKRSLFRERGRGVLGSIMGIYFGKGERVYLILLWESILGRGKECTWFYYKNLFWERVVCCILFRERQIL